MGISAGWRASAQQMRSLAATVSEGWIRALLQRAADDADATADEIEHRMRLMPAGAGGG
jgi:hypothetical protein